MADAKRIVDLFAGIAVIFTLLFIGLQWNEMRKGGEDTRALAGAAKAQADAAKATAQSAKSQADNTATLAAAAVDQVVKLEASVREIHSLASAARTQAEASAAANKIAIDAATVAERAWVSVTVGEQTGNFSVSMRNTGKTPAINVTEVTAFAGGRRMGPPDVDFSQNSSSAISLPKNAPPEFLERLKKEGFIRDHPPSGYVIAPGDSQIASDYQGKFTQIFRIEGDRVYVQGKVTYDDIFGKSHETLFCYWFAPPSDFIMCNDHNKMN